MTRYQQLLEEYAQLVALESAADLLLGRELLVAGLAVGLDVEGDEEAGNVVLFTSVGQIDNNREPASVMRLMLEANALWVGTGGCTLGVQSGSGAVLLCIRAPLALCSAGSLARMVDAFADVALLWREVIQRHHTADFTALPA